MGSTGSLPGIGFTLSDLLFSIRNSTVCLIRRLQAPLTCGRKYDSPRPTLRCTQYGTTAISAPWARKIFSGGLMVFHACSNPSHLTMTLTNFGFQANSGKQKTICSAMLVQCLLTMHTAYSTSVTSRSNVCS